MNQVLYRKWRPQTWDDVVGQHFVTQTLRQAVAAGKTAHAYLFSGPRGTGKTSMARILAKAMNCLAEDPAKRPCNECRVCKAVNEGAYLDLIEIDAASNTGVEDIRDLRERVLFSPADGRFKVYIIDEVHMLSTAAFNALLKTLEEPPAHVLFILATTEAHKIPATVISRCQRHEFRRLSVEETVARLTEMTAEEGLTAEREALELVARQATGSMRDAVSLLDQLGSLGEPITLARTLEILGSAGSEAVQQLVERIADGDAEGGLKILQQAVDAGTDARQFARQVVDYLRGVLLAGAGNAALIEATPDVRASMTAFAAKMDTGFLVRAIRSFSQAATDNRSGWRPQLPLELAFIDSILREDRGSGSSVGNSQGGESSGRQPTAHPAGPARTAAEKPSSPPSPKPITRSDSVAHAEPVPAPEPASSGITLSAVLEAWTRVLAGLRERDHRAYTLFAAAQPVRLEGEVLQISVASDLIRQKCTRVETQTLLQGVLAEVVGAPLRIRCVVAAEGVPGATPSAGKPAYPEGGMVDTATREFGAQIIDLP